MACEGGCRSFQRADGRLLERRLEKTLDRPASKSFLFGKRPDVGKR